MTSSKAFEALRRLKTSDLLYFEEQFMYGHREILLNYCLNKNQPLNNGSILRGSVNHGFAYQENIWKLRQRNLKPAKRYVWNFRQKLAYGENPNVLPKKYWHQIRNILETLLYEEGIEYVDITPYNFIEKEDKIYIIDFGDAYYTNTNDKINWFLQEVLDGFEGWNPDFR
jgi:hypothetical protein